MTLQHRPAPTLRLSLAAALAILSAGQPAQAQTSPTDVVQLVRQRRERLQAKPHQGKKEIERHRKRIASGRERAPG